MKKNELDFLVIGVQKCATTWIYECLYEHPEICLPKHKREHEYIGGDLYREKGIDWYFSLLNHCTGEKIKGDVSVEYIVNKVSPKLLYDVNPNMKFIISIRNPADRALSAIKWYIRKGTLPSDMSVIKNELAKAIQNFSFSKYNMVQDIYDVLYRGFYSKQLDNYYEYFDKSNFLVVHYEDIKLNAEEVLKDIHSFLGVDKGFLPGGISSKPKKNSNNKLLMKIERTFPKNKVVSVLVNKLHQRVSQKETFSALENEIRNMLDEFYNKHKDFVYVNEYNKAGK